jgi:hypothetical protein
MQDTHIDDNLYTTVNFVKIVKEKSILWGVGAVLNVQLDRNA